MITIASPIAGLVAAIEAAEGAAIEAGDTIIIVESMKMEIPVEAEAAGTVRKLLVAVGEQIAEGRNWPTAAAMATAAR